MHVHIYSILIIFGIILSLLYLIYNYLIDYINSKIERIDKETATHCISIKNQIKSEQQSFDKKFQESINNNNACSNAAINNIKQDITIIKSRLHKLESISHPSIKITIPDEKDKNERSTTKSRKDSID